MPPKKAQESQFIVPEVESDPTNGIAAFDLPKSLVTRIAKGALPAGGKTSKDVPPALQKSATVFISYLTRSLPSLGGKCLKSSSAQEIAAAHNQKTLSAQHVLDAVRQLPWSDADDIEKEMQEELRLWRQKKAKPKSAAPRKGIAPAHGEQDAAMADIGAQEAAQTSEEEDAPDIDEPDDEEEEPDDETQMAE